MLSLLDSGLVESLSTGVPRVSVNAPLSERVLAMSTVPTVGAPPGRMFEAVSTALLAALLNCDSVPVLNTFAGFADEAVKSAPEATVTPTAASTVASVARVRRGCRVSGARDMGLPGGSDRRAAYLWSHLAGGSEGGFGSAVVPVIGWNRVQQQSANAPTLSAGLLNRSRFHCAYPK